MLPTVFFCVRHEGFASPRQLKVEWSDCLLPAYRGAAAYTCCLPVPGVEWYQVERPSGDELVAPGTGSGGKLPPGGRDRSGGMVSTTGGAPAMLGERR